MLRVFSPSSQLTLHVVKDVGPRLANPKSVKELLIADMRDVCWQSGNCPQLLLDKHSGLLQAVLCDATGV